MRFDFSKQQQRNRGMHARIERARRLMRTLSPLAGAIVVACAGALLVFAPPPDARWIDALTWQSDGRARLARQADAPSSVSPVGSATSALVTATEPALSVIDVALNQG